MSIKQIYLLLSFFIEIFNSKVVRYIYNVNDYGYHLYITLGTPCDAAIFAINLLTNYSYITPLNYNRTNSSSVKSFGKKLSPLELEQKNISCELLQETIELVISMNNDILIDDMYFYYFNYTFVNKNTLTFAHIIPDTNFSILHNLYNRKKIDKLQFALFKTEEERGYFYFGGVPDNIIANLSNITITIEKDSKIWNAPLNKMIIGDKEFNNKHPMRFETNERKILFPHEMFAYLQDNIFNEYVKNKSCTFKQDNNVYECIGEHTKFFPNIDFIISNIKFPLNGENLYKKNFDVLTYQLSENLNGDEIIIGVPFFDKYPVLFDYENSLMTFYRNSSFQLIEEVKQSNMITWKVLEDVKFGIITVVLLFGIAIIIGICHKKEEWIKKIKKEKEENNRDILLQDI